MTIESLQSVDSIAGQQEKAVMLKRQVTIPQKQQHRHLMKKKFSTIDIYAAKKAYKRRKIKENRKFLFRDIFFPPLVFS